MNRILIEASELDGEKSVTLKGRQHRHVVDVLQAKEGDCLRVGVINGAMGRARVVRVHSAGVDIVCTWEEVPVRTPIDLILALPRPKVMRRLWPQLAMLGVNKIVLIRAEKVERYYFDSHVLDPEIYHPLLVEGVEQAGCTQLPEVFIQKRFKPYIEDEVRTAYAGAHKWIADPSASRPLFSCAELIKPTDRLVVAVGPEGGWTAYERELFERNGFLPIGLGRRILRSDTALISILSVIEQMREFVRHI